MIKSLIIGLITNWIGGIYGKITDWVEKLKYNRLKKKYHKQKIKVLNLENKIEDEKREMKRLRLEKSDKESWLKGFKDRHGQA